MNNPELSAISCGEVNKYIKKMFSGDYLLRRIYVKGEVSNLKYHSSGHIYFSLKDETGTLSCVMFAGARSGLSFRMEEGQQVIVLGSIEVYEPAGKYQLYAREIILSGSGLLYEKYLKLKKELEDMGMFDRSYKKPIPAYAGCVGIVTASTGAAIRDIESVSALRNPYVQLILYPAQVQGNGAAESIVRGIRKLNELAVDVIIVGRGGGSIEDLWAFNEEAVARAIFESEIPVISAVGHETDFTISDFVADLRVPTPTAAAQAAVFSLREFNDSMNAARLRMSSAENTLISRYRDKLYLADKKLSSLSPRSTLRNRSEYLIRLEDSLKTAFRTKLERSRHDIEMRLTRLKALSPLTRLEQGYSYTERSDGHAIKSIRDVEPGDDFRVYVTDGMVIGRVTSCEDKIYG